MSMQLPDTPVIPEWTAGDRLRKARESTGLSGLEFASEIGVSRRTITGYENGERALPRSLALLYQMRSGVPAEWIMSGKYTPRDLNPEPTDFGSVAPVVPLRRRMAVAA